MSRAPYRPGLGCWGKGLILSVVLSVPIIMTVLPLVLKDRANRRTNLIVGAFFIAWEIFFMVASYLSAPVYEIFWGILYLVFVTLVVWFAWKWPQQGS